MSTERTPEQWLGLPEQDLPTELAKALAPGPWKHGYQNWTRHSEHGLILHDRCCPKCGLCISVDIFRDRTSPWMISVGPTKTPCSVPDPITIDYSTAIPMLRKVWNEAKAKMLVRDTYAIAAEVWRMQYPDKECYSPQEIDQWLWREASPKQQLIIAALIAAAMASGRKEE